jgi:predicted ester cyclase
MESTAVHSGTAVDPAFLEDWRSRYLAGWLAHDIPAILEMVADDVVWDDPALPKTFYGREAVRHFLEATFKTFPDVVIEELEPVYVSATRPKVLAPYRFSGTMLGDWEPMDIAATGARVSFEGIDQWEFQGNVMSRYNTRYDLMDVARQMGVLPAQGSRADRLMTRLQHLQARFQRRRAA